MRILIQNAANLLRPGMRIKTNGDADGTTASFTGTVLCVHESEFYVGRDGDSGGGCVEHLGIVHTYGHRYSWTIQFNSRGWIESNEFEPEENHDAAEDGYPTTPESIIVCSYGKEFALFCPNCGWAERSCEIISQCRACKEELNSLTL